eukprot:8067175-Pyramimonas_sp.AAC.1
MLRLAEADSLLHAGYLPCARVASRMGIEVSDSSILDLWQAGEFEMRQRQGQTPWRETAACGLGLISNGVAAYFAGGSAK